MTNWKLQTLIVGNPTDPSVQDKIMTLESQGDKVLTTDQIRTDGAPVIITTLEKRSVTK